MPLGGCRRRGCVRGGHRRGRPGELPIIDTYPLFRGLRLHSLAYPVLVRCAHCSHRRESTMVALDEAHAPVCPACYAHRLGEHG